MKKPDLKKLFTVSVLALLLVSMFVGVWQIKPAEATTATFGNTNVQSTYASIGGAGYFGGRFQLTEAGTAINLTGYIRSTSGTHNVMGVIYNDTAGPLPDALQCYSDNVSVSTAGWYNFTLTYGTTSLSVGYYWLYFEMDDAALNAQFEDTGGTSNYRTSAYAMPPDNPAVTGTAGTKLLSIYCTYSVESESPTVTVASPKREYYVASNVSVDFSASGGTIDKKWFNLKNDTTWVYETNQTYTTVVNMTGLVNGKNYTFYAWANNTLGNMDEEIVRFNIDLAGYKCVSGSVDDIQSKIDAAHSAGSGNVYVPSGNFTFTLNSSRLDPVYSRPFGLRVYGGVNLTGGIGEFPTNTILFLQGGSAPLTNSIMAEIYATNGVLVRISGIYFQGWYNANNDDTNTIAINVLGSYYRVDHCNFTDFSSCSIGQRQYGGETKGLIDHINIDNQYRTLNSSVLWAYGIIATCYSEDMSWDNDTSHFRGQFHNGTVFVEDSFFNCCRYAFSSNAGAYYIFRRNTVYILNVPRYTAGIDIHQGDQQNDGGRGAEVYSNIFVALGTPYQGESGAYKLRSGMSLLYNNTVTGEFYSSVALIKYGPPNPDEMYKNVPCDTWEWGNVYSGQTYRYYQTPSGWAEPIENDVWTYAVMHNDTDFGLLGTYTPYIYPHPWTEMSAESSSVTVTITYPDNTTYTTPSIPVQFSASGGTIEALWYNCKNGTDWVYAENQTYTTPTSMTDFLNGTVYTFYAFANNTEGNSDEATVMFSVEIAAIPSLISTSENQYVSGDASQHHMVNSSTGILYAVYYRALGGAGNLAIYIKNSSDNGNTWQGETLISTLSEMDTYLQWQPDICIDSNDYLYVTWTGASASYAQNQIWFSMYDGTWSTPIPISTYAGMNTTAQACPANAIDSNDCLHVVWYGYATGYTSYRQIWEVDYNGTWSTIVRLSTYTSMDTNNLLYPAITVDSSNNLDVIFRGNATGYGYSEIWFTNRTGTSWSSPIVISTYAGMDTNDQISPAIAIDSDDIIYAIWYGTATGITSNQIWVATYTTIWNTPVTISTYAGMASYSQTEPSISIDPYNQAYVFWHGKATGYASFTVIWVAIYNGTWNTPQCLWDSSQAKYATVQWSSYPSFNSPITQVNYMFTEGTASPYDLLFGSLSVTAPSGTFVTITVIYPTNTTYTTPTISVEISASGGTIDKIWWNCKNGTSWIYGTNQTYTAPTSMTGFVNGSSYTFYGWANNTLGEWDEETVMFTVAISAGPDHYYFNFGFYDLDSNDVESHITWQLYNSTQLLTYTEGQATLLNGTYTLKTYYHVSLINQTDLDTATYGNTTINIYLQVKAYAYGYLAFSNTVTSLVLNNQSMYNLTFTISGEVPTTMTIDFPHNPAYIFKDGVEQTGWTYTSGYIVLTTSSLSVWQILYGSTVIPPILFPKGGTYYFITGTRTTNNVTGSKLDSSSGFALSTVTQTNAGNCTVSYAFTVWIIKRDGSLIDVTGITATITRLDVGEGFQNGLATISYRSLVLGYQALRVRLYISFNGGAWIASGDYVTDILLEKAIDTSTWNFTVYTKRSYDVGTNVTSAQFMFGDQSHNSRIGNVAFIDPLPQEIALWKLGSGDIIGGVMYPFMLYTGSLIYGLGIMFVSGVLYLRHKKWETILVCFLLYAGGSGIGYLIPDVAYRLVYIIIWFVLTIVLYRVFR